MGNVLITGGSGFVGLHVCEMLATRIDGNGTVLSLDLRPGETPSLNNKIKMVTGDISNFQELLEIVRRYEVEGIIAVAAMVGGSDTAKAPLRALSVNTLGPAN